MPVRIEIEVEYVRRERVTFLAVDDVDGALAEIDHHVRTGAKNGEQGVLRNVRQIPPRWGARLTCGCWWDAPPGSYVAQPVVCALHGGVKIDRCNVAEPDPTYLVTETVRTRV